MFILHIFIPMVIVRRPSADISNIKYNIIGLPHFRIMNNKQNPWGQTKHYGDKQ